MTCDMRDCHAQATDNSIYCQMHKAQGSFAFSYREWDWDHWRDRLRLLHDTWDKDHSESMKKKIIRDLIIHAHDFYE